MFLWHSQMINCPPRCRRSFSLALLFFPLFFLSPCSLLLLVSTLFFRLASLHFHCARALNEKDFPCRKPSQRANTRATIALPSRRKKVFSQTENVTWKCNVKWSHQSSKEMHGAWDTSSEDRVQIAWRRTASSAAWLQWEQQQRSICNVEFLKLSIGETSHTT